MNKQVAITGLLGAASATCEGPFVTSALEFKTQMEEAKVEEEGKTQGLLDAQIASTAAFDARTTNYTDQFDLMVDFQAALTTAQTDWQTKSDEIATIQGKIDEYTLTVAAASGLLDDVTQTRSDKNDEVVAQQAIQDDLDAAFTEHTTEKATLEGIRDAKDTAKGDAEQAWDDADQAKTDAETAKAELCATVGDVICNVTNLATCDCTMGEAQLLVLATSAATNAADDITTLVTGKSALEATAWSTWNPEKKTYDKNAMQITIYTEQCKFYDSQNATPASDGLWKTGIEWTAGVAGDNAAWTAAASGDKWDCDDSGVNNNPQKVLKTAAAGVYDSGDAQNVGANSAWTTWNSAKSGWEGAMQNLGDAQCLESETAALKAVAQANEDAAALNITSTLTDALSDRLQEKTDATDAFDTAVTNVGYVTTQLQQAVLDQGRSQAILDTLNEEMVPLGEDIVIKTYLHQVQVDLKAGKDAEKDAATDKLAELLILRDLAQETVDRANLQLVFYSDLLATATLAKTTDDDLVTMNADSVIMATDAIDSAVLMWEAAVSECKQDGYKQAQLAKKAKMDQIALDDTAIATVADEYAVLLEKPAGGVAGAICAYDVTPVGTAPPPRQECDEGLCCGAAQKVMKDGTKLAIETCQAPETRTYEYYPPLPARAVTQPTPETWRFQCISGAQKLVAAATAALAASYMMA